MIYTIRNKTGTTIHLHVIDGVVSLGLISIKTKLFEQWCMKMNSSWKREDVKKFLVGDIKELLTT